MSHVHRNCDQCKNSIEECTCPPTDYVTKPEIRVYHDGKRVALLANVDPRGRLMTLEETEKLCEDLGDAIDAARMAK